MKVCLRKCAQVLLINTSVLLGQGKPSQTLTPQYTATFTSFRDLAYDNIKKNLVKLPTKICLPISVLETKGLPSFDLPEIKVVDYLLRMSLYDKTSVLSNVHTMKARLHKGDFKFSSKVHCICFLIRSQPQTRSPIG